MREVVPESRAARKSLSRPSNVPVCGNNRVGTAAPGCPVERSSTAQSARATKLRHSPRPASVDFAAAGAVSGFCAKPTLTRHGMRLQRPHLAGAASSSVAPALFTLKILGPLDSPLDTSNYNPSVKCPHCLVEFHDQPMSIYTGQDVDGHWAVVSRSCPSCKKLIFMLQNGSHLRAGGSQNVAAFPGLANQIRESLVRPRGSNRPPCPVDVPKEFAGDYEEACLVLPDSAKAAAALGRRCLQKPSSGFCEG